ncbi:elongation factor P maturation arginine rhamnosyltransferase EarP [Neisseria sp. S1]|uniref:elongation factor P maturation arginine rhamnosyltransferase EarP n=1 Tax=Neisseria sp. S1 TaxID=3318354 RepID=UPI003A86EF13
MSLIPSIQPVCWLFCNVIDNYGDIGVAWRLAQGLTHELGWQVYLWLDDETALRTLCPTLPSLPCQYENIRIQKWQPAIHAEGLTNTPPPTVAIETFACDLPPEVCQIIRKHNALWLNWEYLSAEESNERLHGLSSLQTDGGQKYFWFMGFSEKSGGLLREKNYAESKYMVAGNMRRQLLLPVKKTPEWLWFGYKSEVWAKWLDTLRYLSSPVTLLLAGNQIIESLKESKHIPQNALQYDGDTFQMASVTLVKIPFIPQKDFDHLLHMVDSAIVRGEDSFVRAQFSGKPFLWHIYPQQENIHLDKLSAFWQRVYAYYPTDIIHAHNALSDELNGARQLNNTQRLAAWQELIGQMPRWHVATSAWQQTLFKQPSAFEKLAKFAEDKLK